MFFKLLALQCLLIQTLSLLRTQPCTRTARTVSLKSNAVSTVETNRKVEIITTLKNIVDPTTGIDIVTAGQLSELNVYPDGVVNIGIDDSDILQLCIEEINKIHWVSKIDIVPKRSPSSQASTQISDVSPVTTSNGMTQIKHIIAVSSCKGGVGKSTVSVNLAYTLKMAGAKVGILDADIYGPSLPTMTKPASTDVVYTGTNLLPLEFEGVKLMSMGFINKGASIMRGPMVNQVLNQFVQLCDWGDLDYLIVDMPPGTGDIQLTLAQIMNISAAVIVTTPQRLSFVDVVKGIDLFDTVNIPCVAVVENMAEYSTYEFSNEFYDSLKAHIDSLYAASILFNPTPVEDKIGLLESLQGTTQSVTHLIQRAIEAQKQPVKLFGNGHTNRLREMWGVENIVTLPLQESVSSCGDRGLPYVLQYPDSAISASMVDLATYVIREIDRLAIEDAQHSEAVDYDPSANQIVYGHSGGKTLLRPYDVRINCRCATCVEEFTGKRLLDTNSVPGDVRPRSLGRIGRYAVSVDWSDGHKSLYPFRALAKLGSN